MDEEEREEKIRKLREISKKDRSEIEEAQSLVKGTEDLIKEIPIKEEVKVPELEEHIAQIVPPQRTDYSREEEAREERKEVPLEETVEHEQEQRKTEQEKAEQVQYNLFREEFGGKKTEDVYNAVKDVYDRMAAGGHGPNSEEMDKINAARYVAHKREEEVGRGNYGRISENISEKLVLTEKMGSWISRMYKH